MNARRGGLGRGLGALIPRGLEAEQTDSVVGPAARMQSAEPTARYAEVPIDAITPNPRQPRQHFDEEALEDLAHSIREVGLLQPVVVRERSAGRYELVMGERRWRAAQAAGLTEVPALVRETEDTALLRDALLENLHRQQLNPLEEAAAYQQLLEEFDATHDELAARLGRSRPVISNTLRLLQLPAPVQRRVAAGVLSAGHARALLSLNSAAAQEALATRVVSEGLSVRAVEELVSVSPPEEPTRRRRHRREAPPEVQELTDRLSDRLDTRVRVEPGRAKSRLVVEYAGLDDLRRIVSAMGIRQVADARGAWAEADPASSTDVAPALRPVPGGPDLAGSGPAAAVGS